jgi:hypothetical protein
MKRYVAKGNEKDTHLKGVPCSVCIGQFSRARCVPGSPYSLQNEQRSYSFACDFTLIRVPDQYLELLFKSGKIKPIETLIIHTQNTKLVDNQRIKMPSLCLQRFKNLIPKIHQQSPWMNHLLVSLTQILDNFHF